VLLKIVKKVDSIDKLISLRIAIDLY